MYKCKCIYIYIFIPVAAGGGDAMYMYRWLWFAFCGWGNPILDKAKIHSLTQPEAGCAFAYTQKPRSPYNSIGLWIRRCAAPHVTTTAADDDDDSDVVCIQGICALTAHLENPKVTQYIGAHRCTSTRHRIAPPPIHPTSHNPKVFFNCVVAQRIVVTI